MEQAQNYPVEICYDYLLRKQSLVKSVLAPNLYDSAVLFTEINPTGDWKEKRTEELLGLDGIEIEGAFLRSVSGGQRTGTYMHAAMDLKISGKLSDDLFVKAILTDQQLPFEPEGNTQRLQDFDRVNIQLIHDNWMLEGGDINLKSSDDLSFLRYNRLVQGIGVSTPRLTIDSTKSSNTSIVSSISSSKVGTQNITPIEGVLGPYRIEGPQNEPFIFLIAGSERVFVNGELLNRGIENDYVIDYNAAEIVFNPTIYISKYNQILIEFEYSDQQFGRNVTAFKHRQQLGKLSINAGYFQENDNISNPITELSQIEMEQLAEVDANLGFGYINAVDSADYEKDKVLYARVDTLINNEVHILYRHTQQAEAQLYRLNFSFVGQGEGNYIRSAANTNSTIYEWVAPLNGIAQGNYAPVRKIALPQQSKLLNVGLGYQINKTNQINVGFASSAYTANRFNPEKSQHQGFALKTGYTGKKQLDKVNLRYGLSYEYLDSAFSPIQNFRQLDFNREWGINQSGQYLSGEEHLLVGHAGLSVNKHTVAYEIAYRDKLGALPLSGTQNTLNYRYNGDVSINTRLYNMQSQQYEQQNSWQKVFTDVAFTPWAVKPGYRFNYQRHAQIQLDSVVNSFQHFYSHEGYLSKQDSGTWNFTLSHEFRTDFMPGGGAFVLFEKAQTSRFDQQFNYGNASTIKINVLRRAISNQVEASREEAFYQGALSWSSSFWNNNISHQFYYQTGTGRVLERSYFFQEVALGLGTHSWADLNSNDEKELEEFFEDQTTYGDRNFIKVFNFSNAYQTAYINNMRYLLNVKMPRQWRNQGLVLSMLSHVSGQWQVNIENKNTYEKWSDRINPLNFNAARDDLLSAKNFIKTSIFLNRGGRLNTSFNWLNSNRKQLLLNGFESNFVDMFSWQSKWNISKDWDFLFTYKNGQNASKSDLLVARNYAYSTNGVTPALQWQHFKNWRVSVGYEHTDKSTTTTEAVGEGIVFQKFDINTKWIKSTLTMLEGSVGLIRLTSQLESEQTPQAFEMFEGLRAGDNVVWNLNFRQKLFGGLNLNMAYNGRKTPENRTVQFGSVQLSALF